MPDPAPITDAELDEWQEDYAKGFVGPGVWGRQWAILNDKYPRLLAEVRRLRASYQELIYAVESKYPGERRHETALRYIKDAERSRADGPAKADVPLPAEPQTIEGKVKP